ncbi:MAG: DUF4276 family protein [Candidatus Aminicenantes bacterium]|nr:DUF4276 family protein [Candidatus Aminicenantes bacterium]
MGNKGLFILVEGDDDERFFNRVVNPQFTGKYDWVKPYKYAQVKPENIRKFIHSISAMQADYIIVADSNDSPCITARKEKLLNGKFKEIDRNRIQLVIREIEGWYLAGLNDKARKEVGIKNKTDLNTDNLTKEDFNRLKPQTYSRIDFMQEILKRFDISTARENNRSFDYFCNKYL